MTSPDAVDYSFSRPTSPQALAAQGIKLVQRYLSDPPSNAKNATAAELRGLLAAGIGIILGWEQNADRAREGWNAGTADGAAAGNLADAIGYPRGLSIYFAVDFDTTSADYPAIKAYFQGVAAGLAGRYRVGVYGEADVVDYLHGEGLVTCEWQTYAWSRGRLSPEADLYQYLNGQQLAGATVDFDRIIHPELLGAWWPDGLAPLGSGISLGDDDLSDLFTPAEARDIARAASILCQTEDFGPNALSNMIKNAQNTRDHVTQAHTAINITSGQVLDVGAALVPLAAAIGKLSVGTSDPALAAQLADIQSKLAALASKTYQGTLS